MYSILDLNGYLRIYFMLIYLRIGAYSCRFPSLQNKVRRVELVDTLGTSLIYSEYPTNEKSELKTMAMPKLIDYGQVLKHTTAGEYTPDNNEV